MYLNNLKYCPLFIKYGEIEDDTAWSWGSTVSNVKNYDKIAFKSNAVVGAKLCQLFWHLPQLQSY